MDEIVSEVFDAIARTDAPDQHQTQPARGSPTDRARSEARREQVRRDRDGDSTDGSGREGYGENSWRPLSRSPLQPHPVRLSALQLTWETINAVLRQPRCIAGAAVLREPMPVSFCPSRTDPIALSRIDALPSRWTRGRACGYQRVTSAVRIQRRGPAAELSASQHQRPRSTAWQLGPFGLSKLVAATRSRTALSRSYEPRPDQTGPVAGFILHQPAASRSRSASDQSLNCSGSANFSHRADSMPKNSATRTT